MASMKTRVIAHVESLVAEYNDLPRCEKQLARLRELGAPDRLVELAAARNTAMRQELPVLLDFLRDHVKPGDSLKAIFTAVGAAGFSEEALYAVSPA